MIELNGSLEPMIKELRNVFSSISGVKKLGETMTLTYVVEISSENDRESAEKVGAVLQSQAEKYGFLLDVIVATSEEINKSKELMAEHVSDKIAFKA